jgi:hypothetical protein
MTSDSIAPASPASQFRRPYNFKTLAFIVICLTGFVFYALFNKQVFPAASIDIKLTQNEATAKSRLIAEKLGYDLKNTLSSTTFTVDDDAKTVLEFKLGIAEANQVMKDKAPVWLWHTRFCKPLSDDQVYVSWTTNGQFKSAFHLFPNDKKFQTVSQEEALEIAKSFVSKIAGFDLTGYELYDRGSESKPNRTDHHFGWYKNAYPESQLRVRVEVAGNQVSSYRYYLAPTDTWSRDYKRIRESNELLGKAAAFFLFFFLAATLVAFVYGLTRHDVRWRFTLISSAAVAILVFLDQLNNFSYSFVDNYRTSVDFSNFLVRTFLLFILQSLGAFAASIVMVGGAETVYRASFPKHVTLPALFSLKGIAQTDYARKLAMGYLLPGLMMFWMISYYKFGERFGYFCPLGVDDYRVLGNYFPALSGALIGVSAAGLEELSCRVVGLGLLTKWLKSFWVANLLQAMIWGFAHSQYPQEPSYARGIELTVIGLIFGAIVRSYGVLPCMVAHYLYDAFLTVEPVFASHQALLILPSVAILLPFAVALWYCRHWAERHQLEADAYDLSNAAAEKSVLPQHQHEQQPAEVLISYIPLSKASKLKLIGIAVVGLTFLALPKDDELGKSKQVTIDAHQALGLARKALADDAVAVSKYSSVVELVPKPDASGLQTYQYLTEVVGRAKTGRFFDQVEPGLEWRVRFFKALEPKIYWVYLNGDGSKRAVLLEDIDEGDGAKLDKDAAFKIAENYINKNRPEFLPFKLANATKTARPKRNDYSFDLTVPKFKVGETAAKLQAALKGDRLAELLFTWDLPDSWKFQHEKKQHYQQVALVMLIVCGMAIVIATLWWGVHVLRSTTIPWRHLWVTTGVCLTAGVATTLNSLPTIFSGYDTAESLNSFIGQTVATESLRVLLMTIGYALLAAVGLSCLKFSYPTAMQQLQVALLLMPRGASERVMRLQLFIDATAGSAAFIGVMVALKALLSLVTIKLSPEITIATLSFPATVLTVASPLLELLSAIVLQLVFLAMATAIVASFWHRFLTGWRGVLLLSTFALSIGSVSWYWQNAIIQSVFDVFEVFLVWIFVTRVAKQNVLTYAFVFLQGTTLLYLSTFFAHASKVALPEMLLLEAIAVSPYLVTFVIWLIERNESGSSAIAT